MDCKVSVTLKAPPEKVMRALTDAKEIVRWFVTTAETDPKKGGRYRFTVVFTKSSPVGEKTIVSEGEYMDVTPDMIRYTDRAGGEYILKDGEETYPSTVTMSLRKKGDSTELTMVHSGLKEGDVKDYKAGWEWCLDNLKRYLEGGKDKRPAEGQIVK
jgi:uncharacterized protein YndB with AHSA1/START domain